MRELLNESMRVEVPKYQREYTWDTEQAKDFFKDLKNFVKSSDNEYLFGQMIFYEKNENNKKTYQVIDGQQRLATSVIFLSAIRKLLKSECPSCYENLIGAISGHIGHEFTNRSEWWLKLGSVNETYFIDHIQMKDCDKKRAERGSNKKITNVLEYFMSELKKIIEEELSKTSTEQKKLGLLEKYYNRFIDGFKVSIVTTKEEGRAYVVFETLNSRGISLGPSDLLKNYFIRFKKHDSTTTVKQWSGMLETIFKAKGDIAQYVRYHWHSYKDHTSKRNLFKNITTEIEEDEDVFGYLDDLFEYYETYAAMVDPDLTKNVFKSMTEEIKNIFESLKAQKMTVFFPIVIAMKRRGCTDKEIYGVMTNVDNLLFRNITVGGDGGNKYEKMFPRIARRIRDNEPLEKINDFIINETINRKDLKTAFSKFNKDSNNLNKYILKEIYDVESDDMVVKGGRKVHLEHILPETPSDAWPYKKGDSEHTANVNRLGNLTLLHKKLNQEISNLGFDAKKVEGYKKSKIPQTQKLCEHNQWTVAEITERHESLFDDICKRWPRGNEK